MGGWAGGARGWRGGDEEGNGGTKDKRGIEDKRDTKDTRDIEDTICAEDKRETGFPQKLAVGNTSSGKIQVGHQIILEKSSIQIVEPIMNIALTIR